MAAQNPDNSKNDIFPRDQLEHFKMELARLRSENERMAGEVDYLRQALAAALSKIPQLEAPGSPNSNSVTSETSKAAAPTAAPSLFAPNWRWPWEEGGSLQSYAGYLPLASFMAPPLLLLALLVLLLTCAFSLFGFYFFMAP